MRVPRASGDKPDNCFVGCPIGGVFLAQVGINRSLRSLWTKTHRVPRASGDKPPLGPLNALKGECSPSQRG